MAMVTYGPQRPSRPPVIPSHPLIQPGGAVSQVWQRFFSSMNLQAHEGEVPGTTRLITPQFIPTIAQQLFVAVAPVRVDTVVATNSTASAVTIYIYLVPSGQSPGASNLITQASIPASSTVELSTAQGHLLLGNDSLYASAGTASAVSLTATGVVV